MRNGISVIICCYNSSWIIKRCLEALECQVTPRGFNWEIIVVNNNCTDGTIDVVNSYKESSSLNIIIVDEKTPGLLSARKKGIFTARFNYTIFCDDDNLLCPDYVYGMYKIMESDYSVGCAGGLGLPECSIAPYPEFKMYWGCYALGSQKSNRLLYGAGLCVRTEIVVEIYTNQKLYLTGRAGEKQLAGDDGELVASILLRGYKKTSDDNLTFTHVLHPKRLSWEYLCEMVIGFANAYPVSHAMQYVLKDYPKILLILDYMRCYVKFLESCGFKKNRTEMLLRNYYVNVIKAFHFWGWAKLFEIQKSCMGIKNN